MLKNWLKRSVFHKTQDRLKIGSERFQKYSEFSYFLSCHVNFNPETRTARNKGSVSICGSTYVFGPFNNFM